MYEKESQSLEEKVKQMESEGRDEYDIRKQVCGFFVMNFLMTL